MNLNFWSLKRKFGKILSFLSFLSCSLGINHSSNGLGRNIEFITKASKDQGIALPSPKEIFAFGDGNYQVTKELNALVLAGKKSATTSYTVLNLQHWGVGDLSVGLDETSQPCFVMRTTELSVMKFENVDAAFAADEGKGGLILEWTKGI